MPTPASQSIVIEARRAGMAFGGRPILRDVDLTCAPGEFVALLGPSGCGKSTLLRLVAGLDRPAEGELRVSTSAGVGPQNKRPRIGFVFQEPNLLPWRTVGRNIGLPLELSGADAPTRRQRIDESLRLIGLMADDANKFPHMLSGGMKMRVSLARALVTEPEVLLLDEPFAALDDLLRSQLCEELLALWRAKNWTTLFVTHNVAEAVFLSQRIVILGGRPATTRADIRVPLAYPRDWRLRGSAEFAAVVAEVTSQLHEVAR